MNAGFWRDARLFLKCNFQYYSKAMTGIWCALDPDYPTVTCFFPHLLRDTVFEWRAYGVVTPFLGLALSGLPLSVTVPLLAFWSFLSIQRMKHFQNSLAFWRQAAKESPRKFRCLNRYQGELCLEILEAHKWGPNRKGALKGLQTPEECEREAFRVMDRILRIEINEQTKMPSVQAKIQKNLVPCSDGTSEVFKETFDSNFKERSD